MVQCMFYRIRVVKGIRIAKEAMYRLVHPCLISRMRMGTYRQKTGYIEHTVVSIV